MKQNRIKNKFTRRPRKNQAPYLLLRQEAIKIEARYKNIFDQNEKINYEWQNLNKITNYVLISFRSTMKLDKQINKLDLKNDKYEILKTIINEKINLPNFDPLALTTVILQHINREKKVLALKTMRSPLNIDIDKFHDFNIYFPQDNISAILELQKNNMLAKNSEIKDLKEGANNFFEESEIYYFDFINSKLNPKTKFEYYDLKYDEPTTPKTITHPYPGGSTAATFKNKEEGKKKHDKTQVNDIFYEINSCGNEMNEEGILKIKNPDANLSEFTPHYANKFYHKTINSGFLCDDKSSIDQIEIEVQTKSYESFIEKLIDEYGIEEVKAIMLKYQNFEKNTI